MCVCIVCPAPLWVGGACLYVHAFIGVCMYLSVSMYVCMYSLCVCMYTCNACCEASTQTNLLLLSLLLGGPNPFGGGGPRTRNPGSYIYVDVTTLEPPRNPLRRHLHGVRRFHLLPALLVQQRAIRFEEAQLLQRPAPQLRQLHLQLLQAAIALYRASLHLISTKTVRHDVK